MELATGQKRRPRAIVVFSFQADEKTGQENKTLTLYTLNGKDK